MTSWLSRQKKQQILDLSSEAGLKQDDDLRKDDLVEKLDEYLQQNATRLFGNKAFDSYYSAARRTPGKHGGAVTLTSGDEAEVKSVVKARARKPTKVKEEEDVDPSSSPSRAFEKAVAVGQKTVASVSSTVAGRSGTSKTPSKPVSSSSGPAPRRRRSSIPPSPAVIAQEVEDRTLAFYSRVFSIYKDSPIPHTILSIREACSSVTAVQTLFLLLEAFTLQSSLMPLKYAFDLPGIPTIYPSGTPVRLPDLFVLLTGVFWTTTFTWAATSMVVPAFVAYFFNLSIKHVKRQGVPYDVPRYTVDPLSFNIVKALTTWLVYGRGVTFGVFGHPSASRVDAAMQGGYNGVLLGCYICILATIYDAAQRK